MKPTMKPISIRATREMFRVIQSTKAAQAAIMTLRPGQDTGEVQNEHPKAEQWLYVVSGVGSAVVKGRTIALQERTLLLIPKGAAHQIRNTSKRDAMITLNFYVPPAYTKSGEVRPKIK